MNMQPDTQFTGHHLCNNHSNQLLEATATTSAGQFNGKSYSMLNDLYSMALFLNTGGHHLRMMIAAKKWCATCFRVVNQPPPPEAANQHACWTAFLMASFTRTTPRSAKTIAKHADRIKFFFFVFNGTVGGEPSHYTRDVITPPREATLRRMALAAITWILLSSTPPIPVMNKWTKQFPCLTFFVKGMLFGLFRQLIHIAFSAMVVYQVPDMNTQIQDDELIDNIINPEQANDVSWHKVTGRKLQRLRTYYIVSLIV